MQIYRDTNTSHPLTLRDRLNKAVKISGNNIVEFPFRSQKYGLGDFLTTDVTSYVVDCSSASVFYNPLLLGVEGCVAGMDALEIAASRAAATVTHFTIMRPYGIFREWSANKLGITKDSHPLSKTVFDTTAFVAFQIPCYWAILTFSGASPDEIKTALPLGTALGVITGRPYGKFLDGWRKYWGTKSTLD